MKKLFFYLYGQNPVVRNCHCHICHNFTPNQNLSINCCVRFLFLKEVHLLKDGIRFSSWNYNLQCAGPWCEPAVCSTKRMTLKAGDTVLYYNKNKYWYVLYFILLFLCPSSLLCCSSYRCHICTLDCFLTFVDYSIHSVLYCSREHQQTC